MLFVLQASVCNEHLQMRRQARRFQPSLRVTRHDMRLILWKVNSCVEFQTVYFSSIMAGGEFHDRTTSR